MATGIAIVITNERLGGARTSIPPAAIPRVAAALRAEQGAPAEDDTRSDEEFVADVIIADLRERVRRQEYNARRRAAEEAVEAPALDF